MSTGCGHRTCGILVQLNAAKCAAAAIMLKYNDTDWVIGGGLEIGGTYQGMYNLCAGTGEATDYVNGAFCYIACLVRELREEFKIDASSKNIFDSLFKVSDKTRFIMHRRTPVFIGILPPGFSRKMIQTAMIADSQNNKLPACHREMIDFEWFKVSNGTQLESKKITTSSFLNDVRIQIKKQIGSFD